MGNFIDGSTATGVFLIVYSITNESDIFYHAINKENEQNTNISINVVGLTGIEYEISIFAEQPAIPKSCNLSKDSGYIGCQQW